MEGTVERELIQIERFYIRKTFLAPFFNPQISRLQTCKLQTSHLATSKPNTKRKLKLPEICKHQLLEGLTADAADVFWTPSGQFLTARIPEVRNTGSILARLL